MEIKLPPKSVVKNPRRPIQRGPRTPVRPPFRKRMILRFRRRMYTAQSMILIAWFKIMGPPRVLTYHRRVNPLILRAFGATVGKRARILSPVVLHGCNDYSKLTIGDSCILNGNNFLDLSETITLEDGVSLGPGVTIMTHNRFNGNEFLEDHLSNNCGFQGVIVERGAGIKAHSLIVMGITIGKDAVVAGGAVVNRDVPPRHFVAGIPARTKKVIE